MVTGSLKSWSKLFAEFNLNSVNLALQEYKSNIGSYYYQSSCSSSSNNTIDTDLFDGVKNLSGDDNFQYCISGSGSNFLIKAINPETSCQITLNQNLAVNRNSSC